MAQSGKVINHVSAQFSAAALTFFFA